MATTRIRSDDPMVEDVEVDYEADEDDDDQVHATSAVAGEAMGEGSGDGGGTPAVGVEVTKHDHETGTPSKRKYNHDDDGTMTADGSMNNEKDGSDRAMASMRTPPKRARIDKSAAARMILHSVSSPNANANMNIAIPGGRDKPDLLPLKASRGDRDRDRDDDRNENRNTFPTARKDTITSGTSSYGIYVPPFRRKQLKELEKQRLKEQENDAAEQEHGELASDSQAQPQGNASIPTPSKQIQRQKWEKLKKSIHGTINRLNSQTIKDLIHSLFQSANLVRGKGLLAKALLRASTTSPTYAPVYASLLAVINTKLPEIGELVLVRAILTFRRCYARQDRGMTMSITNFIGCLFNQGLCHELLCLELLTMMLEGDPTDDSVEVAVQFTKVVGMSLLESSPAGIHAVMERFRGLLHDGRIGRRVQYKIEELMKIRRDGFRDFPALREELDLVEREEQITFEIGLDDEGLEKEEGLDVFRYDPAWGSNEQDWIEIRKEILGEDSGDEDSSGSDDDGDSETGDDSDDDDSDDDEDGVLVEAVPATSVSKATSTQITEIHDMSEKDLINLRRTIYLTIMSSATFEECSHKLSKMDIPPGKEMELINMVIECCSQERTFLRYYGLIAARFCLMHTRWSDAFHQAFIDQYNTIHRLETNKLRNVAKMFSHLLHTDSLSWSCLSIVHLNEDETTSSSRIFLKILVQEMAAAMGIGKLVKRFETDDPETAEWFKELFPRDNPRKTRYAINFFTSIGLGPLTDGLREYLKNAPKLIMMQAQAEAAKLKAKGADDSDASSVLSSSSSDSSSVSSSSMSSSSGSYSSYSSYSSSDSFTSSSDESSFKRGRRRKRSSGARSGKKRNGKRRGRSYSSDSSASTINSRSMSPAPSSSLRKGKGKSNDDHVRSISRSRSRSAGKRDDRDSGSKGGSKKRRNDSPIGSEIEVQSDPKADIVKQKSRNERNSRRSKSVSRSRSKSSSIDRDRRGGRSSQRRNSRKWSYSRSPSRSMSRDPSERKSERRRSPIQKKKNSTNNRRSNYL